MPDQPSCFLHPDRPPVKECPNCRTLVCGECIVHLALAVMCKRCYVPANAPPPPTAPVTPYVAWEDRSVGRFRRFWNTWSEVASKPDEFFARLPAADGHGLWAGISYNYMWYGQLLLLSSLCIIPFGGIIFAVIASQSGPAEGATAGLAIAAGVGMILAGVLLGIPLMLLIFTTVLHVSGKLLGARLPYETSFRIFSYTWATTSVATLVPYAGVLAQVAWQSVVLYFAGKRVAGLSQERAVLYCLSPLVLWLGCCLGYVGIFVVAAAAGGK